jgi:hypothetical protein
MYLWHARRKLQIAHSAGRILAELEADVDVFAIWAGFSGFQGLVRP